MASFARVMMVMSTTAVGWHSSFSSVNVFGRWRAAAAWIVVASECRRRDLLCWLVFSSRRMAHINHHMPPSLLCLDLKRSFPGNRERQRRNIRCSVANIQLIPSHYAINRKRSIYMWCKWWIHMGGRTRLKWALMSAGPNRTLNVGNFLIQNNGDNETKTGWNLSHSALWSVVGVAQIEGVFGLSPDRKALSVYKENLRIGFHCHQLLPAGMW